MMRSMRPLLVLIYVSGLGACGYPPLTNLPTPDSQLDSASDTSTEPCDRQAAFGPAAAGAGATDVYTANISYDELVVYYRDGMQGLIFRASRPSRTSGFSVGSVLPGMAAAYEPSFDISETVLFMHGDSAPHLYRMTRSSTSADFGDLTSTGVRGSAPFVSPTMLTYGSGKAGTIDLWASPRSGDVLGEEYRLNSLATAAEEGHPVVSADELEIAFTRDLRIMVARRVATTGEFSEAQEVDTGLVKHALPAGFSGDRCRLYISIDDTGMPPPPSSLYVMSRPH
jgi:hypothetical protein